MDEALPAASRGRDLWIGVGATAVAVGAMAVDHLLGNDPDSDDTGLVDPSTFAIASGLSVLTAGALFGWVVPRASARGTERAATVGLVLGVVSVVPGLVSLWIGIPFVVAGAAIALGLHGLAGRRRRRAVAALALGAAVIALGAAVYLVAAIQKLT